MRKRVPVIILAEPAGETGQISTRSEVMRRGAKVRPLILKFITEYIQKHGYSPSIREIGKAVGLSSSSSVHAHLCEMFKSGMLETDAGIGEARAIRVPGMKFVMEDWNE